tara:strand:+ start:240 stop:518 length:279 start_codon:yes stop_codon:yes gene_type:complete
MITSFAHKGLAKFFAEGKTAGIQAKHADRIRMILGLLDAAKTVDDVNFHGANLHPLKGKMQGMWAVKVSGNWRITFRFENGDAEIVDYMDYH